MGKDGRSGQGSGRSTNRLGSLVVFFTNDENFEFFFFLLIVRASGVEWWAYG